MKKISKELQAMEKFLERMDSGELVTPLRLFFVLIVSASMITAISFSVSPDERFHLEDEEEYVANLSSKPFVYNFHEAMKMREENLEFYNYPSHQWFIEKRSGLSLEEFWDLYDSKWPVVVTDAADSWPAIKWTKDFFLKKYSNDTVMVKVNLNGVKSVQPFLFKHFIDQLDNFYERSDSWVYMEDELFIVRRPELQKDIGINKYSEDNFFSLFPEEIKPWDCLLLWGTRYSRSSLHMDPYNWTATSAVLSGQKLWKSY